MPKRAAASELRSNIILMLYTNHFEFASGMVGAVRSNESDLQRLATSLFPPDNNCKCLRKLPTKKQLLYKWIDYIPNNLARDADFLLTTE